MPQTNTAKSSTEKSSRSKPNPSVTKENIVETTKAEVKTGGLSDTIKSLPINPARDLYGIEHDEIQAISYVSSRAIIESQRKNDHFASANIIGAWLISLANHLGIESAKTDLVSLASHDAVRQEPLLIPTMQMVADQMKPWIMHSKDAMRFTANIMARGDTHPLIAIAFLPLVTLEDSLPWFYRAYNLLSEPINLSVKSAMMQNLVAHDGMVRSHIAIPELALTRRHAYAVLTQQIKGYLPTKKLANSKDKSKKRVAILLPSFDHLNHPDFDMITAMIKEFYLYDKDYEFALYEWDENRPDINQKGFIAINDEKTDRRFTASMMGEWRELVKSIRRHEKENDFESNLRLFMSSLYNFQPQSILAINQPHSLVKGALRQQYPLLEWQAKGPYGMTFGQHILAVSEQEKALEEFEKTKQGDLRKTNILPLPDFYNDLDHLKPIAEKLNEAISAAFDI